jgi:3-hydroxyacyl-CoA dehydrogenase/enoyl-CoA hydratase/3-hydroxybutyryl-CoA epimerase
MMSLQVTEDQIAWLTMNDPDTPNALGPAWISAMETQLASLQTHDRLRGLVLKSGKKVFSLGADLNVLEELSGFATLFQSAQHFKRVLRQLETLPFPVVACLNGSALGGGLELALACHARLALNRPEARFGLPEVTLGLIPGGGGTQRLPRLIGIDAALPLMLQGKTVTATQAQHLGILNQILATESDLEAAARAWIQENPGARPAWEEKGFSWPKADPRSLALHGTWLGAHAQLSKKAADQPCAPRLLLAAVFRGSRCGFEAACRLESRYFAQAACAKEGQRMRRALWHEVQALKQGARRPPLDDFAPCRSLAIVGAGMMGHGIACVAAMAGMEVTLIDRNLDSAQAGKQRCEGTLKTMKKSDAEVTELLDRIQPSPHLADAAGKDWVIEAVFENRELKGSLFRELSVHLHGNATLGSNTSSLPISDLAKDYASPEAFIGLHFFSPVPRMPLLEIIVGEATSEATLAKAMDLATALGKVPIVVRDSRGFYTSRVFSSYVLEGIALVQEGHEPLAVERAAEGLGMATGPLAVSDEVSLTLLLDVLEETYRGLRREGKPVVVHPAEPLIRAMVTEWGRPGRAGGGGFYHYPPGQPKSLWQGIRHTRKCPSLLPHPQDLEDRLMMIQLIETAKCLKEGILMSTAEANIGSLFGWGFPVTKGGTFTYLAEQPRQEFLARAKELEERCGPRFACQDWLEEVLVQWHAPNHIG